MNQKTTLMVLASTLASVSAQATESSVGRESAAAFQSIFVSRNFDVQSAYADKQSADWIAVSAMIGTLLWLWAMLYYGKTQYSDSTMVYNQPPIAWFWSNFYNFNLGWTAASYFAYFILYFFVSVMEFATWCMYISGDHWLFGIWGQFSGYAALVTYMLPPLFATFNLALPTVNGGLADHESNGFVNAVMLAVVGWTNWVFTSAVHLVFMWRLNDHVEAKSIMSLREICTCQRTSAVNAPGMLKSCYDKLMKPKCQELVQNALYNACQGKNASCKQEKVTVCLTKYQSRGVEVVEEGEEKKWEIVNADGWTKCKAYEMTFAPVAVDEEDKDGKW